MTDFPTTPDAPDGWVYEWKVAQVWGVPCDLAIERAAGWEDVPAERHPDFTVEFHGLRLMERPSPVHAEAFREACGAAARQAELAASQGGTLEDGDAILTDTGWMPMAKFREEQAGRNGKGIYRGYGGMSHLWRVADRMAQVFDITIVPDWVEDDSERHE